MIKMVHKDFLFLRLLVLFLVFFFVFSSVAAVPATRSLNSYKEEHPSVHQDLLLDQGALDLRADEELIDIEGRMDLERTDYPGTGANNHHDPKTPGRA